MSPSARIPELPRELLLSIFSRLSGSTRKSVRRCSRTFAMLSEPTLFQNMILVPYIDCLEGFATLMHGNPTLARHVRTINYDAEARMNKDNWHLLPGLVEDADFYSASEDAIEMLRNHALGVRDETVEILLLSEVFRTLPSLETIRVLEASAERAHGPLGWIDPERS